MKKIFVAIFIYLVTINHIYSSEKDLSAFDYFKSLPEKEFLDFLFEKKR